MLVTKMKLMLMLCVGFLLRVILFLLEHTKETCVFMDLQMRHGRLIFMSRRLLPNHN